MAKISRCFFCVFLLYIGCTPRVEQTDVEPTKKDSAIADIPVMVDTTFADTASVVAPVDTIVKVVEKDPDNSDTIVVVAPVEKPVPTLQEIYTSQIGVRELTGKNDGKEVEMYLRTVGLGPGYAWCAAFVKWCMLKAGIKGAERINGMALSCENKSNMVYKDGKKIKTPRAGDVGTLYYASLKRIGHTFFFDKDINGTVYESVEGNTNQAGSREGDGVYRKKRSYNATFSISRWD